MQAKIDRFGRVLIPKRVRQNLGLRFGAVVDLTVKNSTLTIQFHTKKALLKETDGILVFTGESSGDIESVIQNERENRDKSIEGF